MARAVTLALAGLFLAASVGCARFGYTDRVRQRVPSPDGKLVAVCQEVPVFDGPEFDVRLERPEGGTVRALYRMGDAGGCDELIWSGDGSTLAVLTSHVAGISIVDVEWAVAHPRESNGHWFHRGFSFSSERAHRRATGLKFVSPRELTFELCEYPSTGRTRRRVAVQPARAAEAPAHPVPAGCGPPGVTDDEVWRIRWTT